MILFLDLLPLDVLLKLCPFLLFLGFQRHPGHVLGIMPIFLFDGLPCAILRVYLLIQLPLEVLLLLLGLHLLDALGFF